MNQTLFAQYYDQHMMDYQNEGWGLMMVPIFIILVAGLILIFVRSNNNSTSRKDMTDPLDIAKTRYAKGEITKAQFDELKKDLKN